MTGTSSEQIFENLVSLLRDFQGRQYSGEIRRESLFFGELGFVSIDAVVLWEKLQQQYGCEFPYMEFVSQMRDRAVIDIQIGELADFLSHHLNSAKDEN